MRTLFLERMNNENLDLHDETTNDRVQTETQLVFRKATIKLVERNANESGISFVHIITTSHAKHVLSNYDILYAN